jgi:NADP-dependent 3-hydroxy acid dehydrogenase YdfG
MTKTILITGATAGFGAAVLDTLCLDVRDRSAVNRHR